MPLHIDGSNADKFHQYLPPTQGPDKPKGLEKLAAGAKAFLNRLGYLVKNRSSIDEKKIINTIDQDPAAKNNPKVVKLYNAALQSMKYPIKEPLNLFELAKKNAIAGKLGNIDDYGLNKDQKILLKKDLAIENPDALVAASRQFGFAEASEAFAFINTLAVPNKTSKGPPEAKEESAKLQPPRSEAVVQAARVEIVKESSVADFSRALDNVMRGLPIDNIPLTKSDREALQLVKDRATPRDERNESRNYQVAEEAGRRLGTNFTGRIVDLNAKAELIRFILLKDQINGLRPSELKNDSADDYDYLQWNLSDGHKREIAELLQRRQNS